MASTRRNLAFGYGLLASALALATVAYAVGFLANAFVPKSVDAGTGLPSGDPVVVNLVLLGLFGLQHSLMARPWFKARWTRLVPEPVERSTYVLFASLALLALMTWWRPLPGVVWAVEGPPAALLWAVYLGGWVLMFVGTETIDGADLMGMRQVRAYRDDRKLEQIDFQTPSLYRYVRNPIVTGFLVAFWATPWMTVGHLLFAGGMTAYVLVGVRLEARDLTAAFGDRYRRYHGAVPAFVPRPWRPAYSASDAAAPGEPAPVAAADDVDDD